MRCLERGDATGMPVRSAGGNHPFLPVQCSLFAQCVAHILVGAFESIWVIVARNVLNSRRVRRWRRRRGAREPRRQIGGSPPVRRGRAGSLSSSYGYRPRRTATQALERISRGLSARLCVQVVECDIRDFFGSIDHVRLLDAVRDPPEGSRQNQPEPPRANDIRVLIADVNPILRGWRNYFRTGNAADRLRTVRASGVGIAAQLTAYDSWPVYLRKHWAGLLRRWTSN